MGAGISSLKKSEDPDGLYLCDDGRQGNALQILMDAGMNYARIRVWVNAVDGYHGLNDFGWNAIWTAVPDNV